tara:strand:+ start:3767 stop:4249 length:483 start_codon:yes stop_codon:yes gene_type:complete
MIKLQNNAISNNSFKILEQLIKNPIFSFSIDDSQDCLIFYHMLFYKREMSSTFAHTIKPLINFLDRSIINAKICVVPRTEKKIELIKKNEDVLAIHSTEKCYYFLNKNNGHINLFKVGDVYPEQNRMFSIHSNLDIQNYSCTDEKYKAYIEIEYFADKYM